MKAETTEASFKIKVQWNPLKTLDLTLCRLHDLFLYLFIRVWASIGPKREVKTG